MASSTEKQSGFSLRTPFAFEQHGNALHLKIEDHLDLAEVLQLDEALWIATTAPVSNLRADTVFLSLLDSDQDGRLRAEEVKDGIRFLLSHLTDYSGIRAGRSSLPLTAINRDTEIGQHIFTSATKVLKRLGSANDHIELTQVRAVQEEVLKGGLDEAGIVLTEAAADEASVCCMKDILRSVGGKEHYNGEIGVDRRSMENFFSQCRLHLDWLSEAGAVDGSQTSAILTLGTGTEQGYALLQALSHKLTQYFLLCDIKRLNPGLLERALDEPYANIALTLIKTENAEAYLADAPLSFLNADGKFDVFGEINPYFRKSVAEFATLVVKPLLGAETTMIDKESLRQLHDFFTHYREWMDRKPVVAVDCLAPEAIQCYLTDASYRQTLERLIDESHKTAFVLENLRELERLLLYQMYILPLTNSFVSFPHLYNPETHALFEEGTLIMDGRHFTLAIRVEDREHHIETCRSSNIFLIYCELYGDDGELKSEIAVPVTSGNRGTIHLNKWGIFNDINGNELHAKVVDLVENPISVTEAIVDPFIRINRSFFSRLEQFSSKAEERLFHREEKKDKKKKDEAAAGFFAGGGVALAAVGSSFAFVVKTLSGLTMKTVLLALLIVAAVIAIPAAAAAFYKISRRDLSTILEGSGWGLNSRMKLTSSQAACFTYRPNSGQKSGKP
ncbi:MAG: hypothetical protein V2I32_08235 [Desulforhopalus sp.]|jgi:hypothetical protein|nr:hypothetical protein [Desulforhopalus sp.]